MIRRVMIALLLPALVAAAPAVREDAAAVTALRLESAGGRTELTVRVEGGDVRWNDFALSGPARVVVDVSGARHALPRDRFENVERGGVRMVRTSQYAPDVVRVVLVLDRAAGYTVERVPEGVRVRLDSGAAAFAPWSTDGRAVEEVQRVDELPAAVAPAGREAAPAPARPVALPRAVAQQPSRAAPITVTFENTEMRDVLASFAEFSGRSIVPGADVAGIVVPYVEIRNQPWDVALASLLRAYGLAAEETESGIIRVDKIENLAVRAQAEPLVTRTIRVNYVPAAQISATLEPLITERGSLSINEATNTVIVTDVPGVVEDMVALVDDLDVAAPQVAIQAKIIFVDRTQLEGLGIKYDLKDSRGNSFGSETGFVSSPVFDPETGEFTGETTPEDVFLIGGNSIAAVGNANADLDQSTLEVATSLLLANRFSLIALVQALQESRLADVQATPQITTLDNQAARIFVGEEITFLTASTGGAGGAGGAGAAGGVTLQPVQVDAGIELVVTPHITSDRRVRLDLRAENSNPTQTSAGLLNVARQEGETQLIVADGETAVIGGLTVTRVSENRSGIPFLMDIPVIGALFRSTEREERKQDLLIMVTPHIVDPRT